MALGTPALSLYSCALWGIVGALGTSAFVQLSLVPKKIIKKKIFLGGGVYLSSVEKSISKVF